MSDKKAAPSLNKDGDRSRKVANTERNASRRMDRDIELKRAAVIKKAQDSYVPRGHARAVRRAAEGLQARWMAGH